jgi:1-deoxy-D-xylulose-5-phosphate reductoisomerase
MKKVIILGSTGSVGRNTIKVIQKLPGYRVIGLAAYANHTRLASQAKTLRPKVITLLSNTGCNAMKKALPRAKVLCGEQGILDMVEHAGADIIVCALSRSLGIAGIMRAIEKRMRVCLATKEILVSFGDVVMAQVKKYGAELLPVDSEHSAVYQCLEGKDIKDVRHIILTASGGPLLNKSIKNVRKRDVLNHPVWNMGAKITVDSATMMNKGLEVIEAHHLFALPPEKIKVVIHPQALCHSLVQFMDGSLLAHISAPDMKLPIQYALTAPDRLPPPLQSLDIATVDKMTFLPPDIKKFPCLGLAYEALRIGKSMPAVLNAANEEAVELFLQERLSFNRIPSVIKKVMHKHKPRRGNIEDYIACERWARSMVREFAG